VLNSEAISQLTRLAVELETGAAARKAIAARIRAVLAASTPEKMVQAVLEITAANLNEVQALINRDAALASGFHQASSKEGENNLRAALQAEAAAAQSNARQKPLAKRALSELAQPVASYDAIGKHRGA